ncbi:BglG family transcription antiterminator [Metasolibacillus sp. FSL K6-0083]|uniref:BglG family transcription antiterminator n=1 Tax=Metasolibacillus sp. FSL K6-0083 TaxID=2921416 RepID=UPI00315A58A2
MITFISSREKMIIEALIVEQEEITIKELSEKIDVSSRTIQRDLSNIQSILDSYQLKLIRKSGVGVQIIGKEQKKQELAQQLKKFTQREYTLEERLTLILCILYEATEPVKLYSLSKDLGVSISTVSADLTKLEEQLRPVQLSILKKRGYGVELSGTENAKRRAISYALSKTLKEEGLFSLIKEKIHQKSDTYEDPISERLIQLVDREKLGIIEEAMKDLYPDFALSMTDSAYVGLIVHLALAIERILQGENITIDKAYLKQIALEPEYPIAKSIISMLEDCFQVDIPEAEVGYIMMHLQGSKLRQQEGGLVAATNIELYRQTKKLIEEMEEQTGFHLSNHTSLLEGLVTHLKPAIHRIEQNMGIVNPLLEEIQSNYSDLFVQVEIAVKKVFPKLQVPKEEIGYLVMHFGSVLIEVLSKGDLKAYVICSSGIGTSKLLASRLLREIPEITEVSNISIFELNKLATTITDRDLIISTIYLQDFHREYIMVNPFLTAEEIDQVQLYARRKMLVQKAPSIVKESPVTVDALTEKMQRLGGYSEVILTVLSNFQFSVLKEQTTARCYIQEICALLEERQVIAEKDMIVGALLEREKNGGIGIPGTRLALYHTRSKYVHKPSFTVHKLESAIWIKGMDGNDVKVDTLLILLSPETFGKAGLEVLSFISTLIIQNEQSTQLFETGEQSEIHSFLATEFERFIRENIN